MRELWASSLGYLSGGMVNYALNYHKTFQCNIPHRHAIWRFCIVAAVGFIANGLLIMLLVETLGLHYLLGQAAASGTVLVWNFVANRYWTFRKSTIGKNTRTVQRI
jgi:putative flippase GtrA